MCEQRYDDRERAFLRIVHPKLCLPDRVREQGFPPIYHFERYVYPRRISGQTTATRPVVPAGPVTFTIGPGTSNEKPEDARSDTGGRGRPRRIAAVKAASATAAVAAATGDASSSGASGRAGDRTIVGAAGGGIITSATVEKLPLDTSESHF